MGWSREKGFYLVNWKTNLEFQLYKKRESLFYSLTTLFLTLKIYPSNGNIKTGFNYVFCHREVMDFLKEK